MESDSDDARPAKTDTPGTQPGGKLRVERDQAVDWPQLVRRCEELQLGARELELDHSLDEELAAIAASKQQSRYKQKRSRNAATSCGSRFCEPSPMLKRR